MGTPRLPKTVKPPMKLLAVQIPESLHKGLGVLVVEQGQTKREIVIEAIKQYLEGHKT